MINIFDTKVAQDVGVNAAIIYQNIKFWCEKNRANDVHKHDGLYWTYNSVAAFNELFPYLSTKQIRTALDTLEKKGYILSGNFNDSLYDRTKWYADLKINNIDLPQRAKGKPEKGKRDLPEREKTFAPEGEPIPDINHIKNTNYIKESKNAGARETAPAESFDNILDSFEWIKNNIELRSAFIDFIKLRQRLKAPLTNKGLKLIINDVYVKGRCDAALMLEILNYSIKNSYRDIYSPGEKKSQSKNSGKYKSNVRRTGAEAGITIEDHPGGRFTVRGEINNNPDDTKAYEAEILKTLDELKAVNI